MLKGLRRRRKNELELSSGVTNIVVGTDDVVKPLLFDSVNFKFQVPIFFKELILHLCYPFGLLLFGKPCHMFNKFVVPVGCHTCSTLHHKTSIRIPFIYRILYLVIFYHFVRLFL